MSYNRNLLFYFSICVIAISFLIYQLQWVELNLEIGPIKTEASIENVFDCFKNQFRKEELWRKFDYDNSRVSVEIDEKRSNLTNIFMTITQNVKILNSENFKFKVILNSEMEIDQINHSISIKSASKDEMIYTIYSIKLEKDNNTTIIKESSSFRVYRMFSSFLIKVAEKKHTMILNIIKEAVELDKNICRL